LLTIDVFANRIEQVGYELLDPAGVEPAHTPQGGQRLAIARIYDSLDDTLGWLDLRGPRRRAARRAWA
jgi:hypothetical protein